MDNIATGGAVFLYLDFLAEYAKGTPAAAFYIVDKLCKCIGICELYGSVKPLYS